MTEHVISVGEEVFWVDGFSKLSPIRSVKIKKIEKFPCEDTYKARMKEGGTSIESIPVKLKNSCVFDLSNGQWAYGFQIYKKQDM